MEPEDDETVRAILTHAGTIRIEDVEADLTAAMEDPLLQDIVERAVAAQGACLTAQQRADAQAALLAHLATDPRVERLLDEIRSGGGKSHVVAPAGAAQTSSPAPRATRTRGRR